MNKTTVKAFVVNKNNVLLLKINENNKRAGTWELPGGTLAPKEDLISGLIREVKEETGLDIFVISKLKTRIIKKETGNVKMHVFYTTSEDIEVKTDKEHSFFKWVDIENAEKDLDNFFDKEFKLLKKEEIK